MQRRARSRSCSLSLSLFIARSLARVRRRVFEHAGRMPLLFNGTTLSRCNSRCDPKANLCSAVPNAPLNTLPPRGVLQRRYYIYGHGAFNFSDVLSALQARMAGQPMDLALPVGEAQYLSDIPIMAALERHPLRTWDADAADMHVIGALPFASHVLALVSGEVVAHRRRMSALTAALVALPPFIGRKKPFLLLHCSPSARAMGEPLMNALGSGNLIVASCDPFHARDFKKPHPQNFAYAYRRGVTIPFSPHSLAYDDDGVINCSSGANRSGGDVRKCGGGGGVHGARSGLMFHGGLGRYDSGLRDTMLLLLRKVRGSVPVDTQTGEMTRGSNRSAYSRDSYARTARSYRAASMCMVPAGDVPSSRRLFDAMSAGCVPVLVRSLHVMSYQRQTFTTSLPFPLSIDWRTVSLWLGPSLKWVHLEKFGASPDDCLHKTKIWLLKWHSQNTAELETTRRNARTVFREFLDVDHNPEGIVWALLREIEHRSKNCDPTNSRHASPFAITWKVDDPNLCPYNDASIKCTTRVHAGCPGFTMRTLGR